MLGARGAGNKLTKCEKYWFWRFKHANL